MPTKLVLAARQSGAREPARPMPHTSRRNMGFAAAFLAHHLPFYSVADSEGRIAWDLPCLTTFHAVMTSRPRWPYHLPLPRKPMIPLWSCQRGEDIPFNNTFYPLSRLPLNLSQPLPPLDDITLGKEILPHAATYKKFSWACSQVSVVCHEFSIYGLPASTAAELIHESCLEEILLIRLGLISLAHFYRRSDGWEGRERRFGSVGLHLLFFSYSFPV